MRQSTDVTRIATTPRGLGAVGTWKVWTVAAVLFVIFAGLMFGAAVPTVTAACGAAPPDVRFHTTHEQVDDFLAQCGPEGRQTYRNLQVLDLAYPAIVGLFLSSSLLIALRRHPGGRSATFLAALGPLAAAFDYVENAMAWRALTAFPASPTTNGLLGIASSVKVVASWGAWTLLTGILAVAIVRRIRKSTTRQTTVVGG